MTTLYTLRCPCGFLVVTPNEREARDLRTYHRNRNAVIGNLDRHTVRVTATVEASTQQSVLA